MPRPVIKIENLAKEYRLGSISHRMLTKDLQSWFARLRGLEDPNSLLDGGPGRFNGGGDRFCALKDVSFTVHEGEVVGIIGRNGAGKSTLLKILSRITTPSRGVIKIRGRVASLLEVGTGFHPELTGRENIFLNGAILGMSRQEVQRRFDEIVAFSEIERFIDTPVKRYSSGMYVRLAFAVAAHLEPEILIVDEVLAVGDAEFQRKCLGKMGEVAGSGRTVLFVSHNLQAVRNLCGRGVLLERGGLIVDGTAAEAIDAYLSSGRHHEPNHDIQPELHLNYPADLEIFRIDLLDHAGTPTLAVMLGEDFSLRLHYRINQPATGYRIGIVISTMDQARLTTVVTSFDGAPHFYGESGKDYQLTVSMNNIFMAGQYQLGIHIKNSLSRGVDVIEGISLTVLPVTGEPSNDGGQGLVRLRSHWSGPDLL